MLLTTLPWLACVNLLAKLLAAYWALRITLHFLEPRHTGWPLALLYGVHYLTVTLIVYVGVGDYVPPLLMMAVFLTSLCLLCKGSLLARCSTGMLLVLLPMSYNGLLTAIRPPFDQYIFLCLIPFWGLLLLFVKKTLPDCSRPPIHSGKLWILINLLTLMPLGAVLAAVGLTQPIPLQVHPDPFYDKLYIQNERVLLIILGLSILATIVNMAAVVILSRHEKMEEAQLYAQVRSQYYQSLEESQQQVRRLRHDLANHLTTLAELDGAAAKAYIAQLCQTPAMQNGRRYCANPVVNAVLSVKVPVIEEAAIPLDLAIRLEESLPISDIDLCALFANSLDNAIEANEKCAASSRYLKLDTAMEKGFFVLKMENAASGPLHWKNGQILTSKRDKTNHGLGLSGIREITARYNGTIETNANGTAFTLLVMIPIKKAALQ